MSMGVGSLLVPIALAKLLEPFVPGKGKLNAIEDAPGSYVKAR